MCQWTQCWLTHRHREQACSHKGFAGTRRSTQWQTVRGVRGYRRRCARLRRRSIAIDRGAGQSKGRPARNRAGRNPVRTLWPMPAINSTARLCHRHAVYAAKPTTYQCANARSAIHQKCASHRESAIPSDHTNRYPDVAARSPHPHRCPARHRVAVRGRSASRGPIAECRAAVHGRGADQAAALRNTRRPAAPDCATGRRFRRGSAAASGDR
ncbi:hypothetical protein D3C72_1105580 [compost metagenome]